MWPALRTDGAGSPADALLLRLWQLRVGPIQRRGKPLVYAHTVLDEVQVRCEVQPAYVGADRAAVARELQHRIKTLCGVSTRVDVLDPDGIERSQGKARRVIDKRPK